MKGNAKRTVQAKDAGLRLDVWLAKEFQDHSRAFFQIMLRRGMVKVNGVVCKPSHPVVTGAEVSWEEKAPPREARPLPVADFSIPVLYEDADVLVVNKPAGLVVHPAPGHPTGTLVDWLIQRLGSQARSAFPDSERSGLVHRLDKETSGILLVAKTPQAQGAMSRQFAERKIEKVYWTLVEGKITHDRGEIQAPVGRSRENLTRMAVSPRGRPAETTFKVLERFTDTALLEVYPKTGRTHQIRVHLSAVHHPVVGDTSYGARVQIARRLGILRPLLHAKSLGFTHPRTRKRLTLDAPIPADFERVLKNLRTAAVASLALLVLGGMSPALAQSKKKARAVAGARPGTTSYRPGQAPYEVDGAAAPSSAPVSESSLARDIKSLKSSQRKLDEAIAALGEEVNDLSSRVQPFQALNNRLTELERAMVELNRKTAAVSLALEDLRSQLEKLQKKPDENKTPSP